MSNIAVRNGMFIATIWGIFGLVFLIGTTGAQPTQTVSIPARTLSFNPGSTIITLHSSGLRWQQNFSNGARFFIRKPCDYAGGEVALSLFFLTTTATPGVVDFFIRPDSFNSSEEFRDIINLVLPALASPGKVASASSMSSDSSFRRSGCPETGGPVIFSVRALSQLTPMT